MGFSIEPALVILCPHLSEPPRRRRPWSQASAAGAELTIGSGEQRIRVHLCRTCSERLGTEHDDGRSLELAALAIVQRRIHERVSRLVDGLREMLGLLR